jgi:HTH-type transcriptional regulator/antitoxin HigA
MSVKPIRNEEDYRLALKHLDTIVDVAERTPEADERDVLIILIEKYEEEHYKIDLPDPLEAIRFRMEQAKLTQKDLLPYIGSRSKVSEVLSGKRDLTLKMIRALNRHLGIPAEVLLQEKPLSSLDEFQDVDFDRFPIAEMEKNGAFRGFDTTNLKDKAEECIRFLIDKSGGLEALPEGIFRKSRSSRLNAKIDPYALQGWSLQVLAAASEEENVGAYEPQNINASFLRALVGLSVLKEGPYLAKEFLKKRGVLLEIVPHLRRTYLDGAAFITKSGRPVIGLTIRHDRVDNFWFTLLHEIGHICKNHLSVGSFIADDMTLRGAQTDSDLEREADEVAEDALIPADFDLDRKQYVSKADVLSYASACNVHPAIVAGRIQHKRNNYRLFANLVGRDEVRHLFKREK